jgi:hypothetical protein
MNECTCPHTATREGLIKNGTNYLCPIHGQAREAPTLEQEPLPDGLVNEILSNVRTINRLHKQDTRWDQTIARDRNGKTIYDYMQVVLEETQRSRATARAILEKMQS